jgi:hypothetical protein
VIHTREDGLVYSPKAVLVIVRQFNHELG